MMPEKVLNSFRDRFFFNEFLDLVNLSKIERPQNAVEKGRDFSNENLYNRSPYMRTAKWFTISNRH